MKKIFALLLCVVFCLNVSAAQTVEFDKGQLKSALYEADIASIRTALELRLITSRELTEYYLERIEAYNDTFNCFITLCDNALEEADKRDAAIEDGTADGALWGIPVVVKDNISYEGYMTTNGLWPDDQISTKNAAVVQTLIDAGAVILGKTNMATEAQEARFSASNYIGETVNAYNPTLAAGGSSGGSAVATSLNFAVCGLGTDTNASLRYPAVLNGCVSLRATTGLIDLEGCIILNKNRDTPGAITRSVEDQAIMLDVLTGGAYYENLNARALQGARLGILSELSYPISWSAERTEADVDDEVQALFAAAVEELKACGAEVIEVSMPDIFTYVDRCEGDSSVAREEFLAAYETLFAENNLTAVIFPTYLHTPQDSLSTSGWTKIYEEVFTSNCAKLSSPIGIPEIAIPIGTHSKGAGVGLEIAGLPYSEQLLLDLAYSYTEQYDHRVAPGTAPNLYEGSLNLDEFLSLYQDALVAQEGTNETTILAQPSEIDETSSAPQTETDPKTEESESLETNRSSAFWLIPGSITIVCLTISAIIYRKHKKSKAPLP